MSETVVIKKCGTYGLEEIKAALRSGFELLGGIDKFVKKDEKVLLKVNCLFPAEPEKAVTTHPVFLKAVVQLLKGQTGNIIIGDSPGFGNFSGSKKTGYIQVAQEEGVQLVDFKDDGEIRNTAAAVYKNFKVTDYVNKVDKIINLPKLKTHGLMYMTLAVKNMFGIVAGTGKPAYHMKAGRDRLIFAQMLVDLYHAKPPVLNIMDGIIGMEGNGPGGGDPVNTGVIILAQNGFALDYVAPQIVGLNPDRVYTNAVYRKDFLGGKAMEVEIKGDSLESAKYRGSFKPTPDSGETMNRGFLFGIFGKFMKDQITPKQIYIKEKCTGCLSCVKACPVDALVYDKEKKMVICDYEKCIRCFICQEICPEKAIVIKEPIFGKILNNIMN
jgi:uncharacterized protein (DUF362 family)/NAD-dependent dihydropyrimidine dehydrogenase PreA subunit